MEAWSGVGRQQSHRHLGLAGNQTKILEQWVQVRCQEDNLLLHNASPEILEFLHQCLDSWRYVSSRDAKSAEEAFRLLCLVDDTGIAVGDDKLRPGDKAYSMCLHALENSVSDPEALDKFDELWRRRSVRPGEAPDLQFYNDGLHFLSKCSLFSSEAPNLAETFIHKCSTHHKPSSSCFVSVMHAWANRHDESSALRAHNMLENLIGTNLQLLSPEAFNVCIDGWAKTSMPEKAEEVLKTMMQLSREGHDHIKPTIVTFNSVVNAWAKSNHPDACANAERVLQTMERLGVIPTLESFTAVMDGYSRRNNQGPRVQKFLENLEAQFALDSSNPAPSKVTYVVALGAWGRTSGDESAVKADALVEQMKLLAANGRDDLRPCAIVYAALLSVWCKSRRQDATHRAIGLIHDLLSKNDELVTISTVNMVLHMLAVRGEAKEAGDLLEFIVQHSSRVYDGSSYDLVLKAYSNCSNLDAAEKGMALLREMENQPDPALHPPTTSYVHIIVAWGNSKRHNAPERAQKLFFELMKKSKKDETLSPTIIAVNAVLRAWARSREGGAANKAEDFFKWLEESGHHYGMVPDGASFFHIMQAWAHSGRAIGPQKVEEYFAQMKEHSARGALKTSHYNLLITAWSRHKNRDEALHRIQQLLHEMSESSSEGLPIAPNHLTVKCLEQMKKNCDVKERQRLSHLIKTARGQVSVKRRPGQLIERT